MKTAARHTCAKYAPLILAQAAIKPDPSDQNYLGFHAFIDPETDETFGSFLIFAHAPSKEWTGFGDEPFEHGFYWQSCFPGTLPDSDSCGPFKTARDAYNDAQNG